MGRSPEAELAGLRAAGLARAVRPLDSPQGPEIVAGGRALLNLSSNDYLGFAADPALAEAAAAAARAFGAGSGSARLICGTLPPHAALEQRLAAFKRTESALAFSSGYATAVGAIPACAGPGDTVILDKLAHASLIDGARLSGATLRVFPHNHTGKLARLLASVPRPADSRVLVVTESVFSMDGDAAPLAEIAALCQAHDATLLVDEAHAVGVVGPEGRGLVDALGLGGSVALQMGTLSKALGASGGYLAASRPWTDLLVNRARSFIYSTAPAPAAAAAATAALERLASPGGAAALARLRENLRHLQSALPARFRPEPEPAGAIFPLILGGERLAVAAARWLRHRGILAPAIRYPTVPRGQARLRVTLSAAHTPAQIERLVETLRQLDRLLASRG
jgi:8-amino-7-oxononanoate synthase